LQTQLKLNSLAKMIKFFLKDLPNYDYPVLDSCLFCAAWLAGILGKGMSNLQNSF